MIIIREERPEDVEAIRQINLAAFNQPAEAEVVDRLRESCRDLLSLVAEEGGEVVGHILFSPASIGGEGATPPLAGMGLAPMAVLPERQGQGIGRALVEDLEACVIARGGATIFLGTDDEAGWTSLAGVDLYPDPLVHLAQIRSVGRHPFAFYRKLGYALIGVVPDANGPGKPDILMAKKVKFHK